LYTLNRPIRIEPSLTNPSLASGTASTVSGCSYSLSAMVSPNIGIALKHTKAYSRGLASSSVAGLPAAELHAQVLAGVVHVAELVLLVAVGRLRLVVYSVPIPRLEPADHLSEVGVVQHGRTYAGQAAQVIVHPGKPSRLGEVPLRAPAYAQLCFEYLP